MRFIYTLCFLSFFHVFTYGQDSTALIYSRKISDDSLKNYIYKLASKDFEGRETGKPGQRLAAAYISSHFKSSGCKPICQEGYFQEIPLSEKKSSKSNLMIDGHSYEFMKDFYFMQGFDDSLIVADNFSFLGYGISDSLYNDFKNLEVRNKVLLILSGEPIDKQGNYMVSGNKKQSEWSRRWKKKPEFISGLNARLLIIVVDSIEKSISAIRHNIESPYIELLNKAEVKPKFPVIYVSKELADNILKKSGHNVESLKSKISSSAVSEFFEMKTIINFTAEQNKKISYTENVLGFIEGSDSILKKEVLVITAHYDHLGISGENYFPGADDDASGTSAVIELSRVFSKAAQDGYKSKRSILFMTFSGEEKGLLGSEYFTKYPVIPLSNIITDLNIDMIGRLDLKHLDNPNYVYIIGSDKISKDLHKLSEETNNLYTKINLDYTYNDPKDPNRFYYRSDHYNFAKYNIPVIFYFNGVHEDYHKSSDTPDKINFQKVKNISKLVFLTAWEIANREKTVKPD